MYHNQGQGIQICSMVPVVLMGTQGEGPQWPKPCKSSSPDPDVEQSSSLVCRYLLRGRIKVVHDSSQDGPIIGPFMG